jgi:hypothetical protein
MEQAGWRRIGAHMMRTEAPNVIFLRDRGDVSPSEMSAIIEEARKLAAISGTAPLWLNDTSQLGHVPAETRKVLAHSDLLLRLGAVAVFGASLSQRVIARLVLNAARLAYPRHPLPPVRFFASEADARAWLTSTRCELQPQC